MYYVTMIDNFMSGWGEARNKTNIYLITCDTTEQAETIKKNAGERPEMSNIKICNDVPYYGRDQYLVSEKQFHELGEIWTK